MTRKELEKKIKNYIEKNPILKEDLVPAVELFKAGEEIGCDTIYVMCVLRYGKLIY